MVDARLPDGSRVNVAVRPIAVDGPLVSIRKFSERAFDMDRLVEVGAIAPAMVEVLAAAVKGKISAIISGGTGSGKTTMLNALSNYIPITSDSSLSRTPRNCNCSNPMLADSRPAQPTSKAREKFASAIW